MYFLLVFEVIRRTCFALTPATPFIVPSSCYWSASSTYTLYCSLYTIHVCGFLLHSFTSFRECFFKRVLLMSSEQEQTEGSSRSTDTTQPVHGGGNSASVDQVFSMFKDYLEKKLEVKTKQIEQKSKIDKEVVQLKYKGNQMQYELNAELDSIIESIETESERGEPNLPLIKKYSQEARELIRKRQKLIKIAGKSKDGWQVVTEYESDELASDSEDEKRLKKG